MEVNEMLEIVRREMANNEISLEKWSHSSCGHATRNRKIKIPKPVDYDTLGVCFHEIGHIVLGHMDDSENGKTRYVEEFEAEMFAIKKLREYGYYNKRYELRAKTHVLFKIAQAKNRGHNMKKVPKEIVDWTRLQINKWNKAKRVFVYYGGDLKTEAEIHKNIKLYNKK
jgi:hypothetical protein